MEEFDLAFSPCPNDTFIFHAMLHGLVDTSPIKFTPHMHDVEILNNKAFSNRFHVTKLSFYALFQLKETYEYMDSGAALGYGCGPLLVAGSGDISLTKGKIAIPGGYTTANLLLKLWNPEIHHTEVTRFDRILEGVRTGEYDGGLIIHEGRFVYPEYGCMKIVDLGEWWEAETGLPIPLGCIAVRRDHPVYSYKEEIAMRIKESVEHALCNRGASRDFVKAHAQELDNNVIDGHIDLYVNHFTLSLGEMGTRAIETVEEMARRRGII